MALPKTMTKTAAPPVVSIRPIADRLLDSLTIAFGENLADAKDHDDLIIEQWIKQANVFVERRRHLLNDDCNPMDFVKQALQAAMDMQSTSEHTRNDVAATNAPQSVSLFATGFTLPPILDIDELQAATPLEQADILQNAYLEDVLQDWETVESILRRGLLDATSCVAFLNLHAKWFGDSKSMPDCSSLIQSTICENLLAILKQKSIDAAAVDQVLPLLWNAWMHWMMQSSLQGEPSAVTVMSTTLLNWHTNPSHTQLLHSWMQLDPSALWLQAWTAVKADAATVCGDRADFVSSMWSKVTTGGSDNDQSQVKYCLSALRSLLVVMRVSTFPWEQISRDEKEAAIHSLLNQYVTYLQTATTREDERMALDAIDTIISGCRRAHEAVYDAFVRRLSSSMLEARTKNLLSDIVRKYQ
ncbi:hypothetical protein MPSEU_000087800 [Mayamaea pseudoterrestris]|nr:hypothetical protein MPSEU_000087800 [Mayamaea pseudoterrestris]